MIQPSSGAHVANDPRIARSPDLIIRSAALCNAARRIDHEPIERTFADQVSSSYRCVDPIHR
jgi:hypothetical protein